MGQGGPEVFDVARSKLVGRKDLDEVCPCFMSELRLGRSIGPQHHRLVTRMSSLDDFDFCYWTDDVLRSRLNGRMTLLSIENRARAQKDSVSEVRVDFAQRAQRLGNRHRDFDS